MEAVEAATARIQRIGCLAVKGVVRPKGTCDVWAVRNHKVAEELERLLSLAEEDPEAYHRGVGRLLGYSEQHIRMFLETERPTV